VTRPLPAAARSDGRLVAWLSIVGLLALANFVGYATGGKPPKNYIYLWSSAVSQLIYLVILFAVVLAITGLRDTRELWALRRPNSWWRALGLGAALIVAVYIVAAATSPLLSPGKDQGLTPSGWDSGRAPQFVANFIVIACLVPIVEELMFRGIGFTLLLRYGQWAAIIAIGVFFALVHGIPSALPVLGLFGGGLAFIRSRCESVIPGMIIHGSFNALSLILAVTT
jgi:membrane protease YdiL (CAAX protease family)